MRILVVDDEPLARESLTRVLNERSDVETVDTAVDAIEALNRMRDHAYDVLLLDIHMPEMSGMQMVDTLRSQGNGTPAIIFVTAFNEHAVAAFERHATDYILKPFSAGEGESQPSTMPSSIRRRTASAGLRRSFLTCRRWRNPLRGLRSSPRGAFSSLMWPRS